MEQALRVGLAAAWRCVAVACAAVALLARAAMAGAAPSGTGPALDEEALHAATWKLTLGQYFYEHYGGSDLNLRWRRGDTDAWLGVYRDRDFGTQTRAGVDTSYNLSSWMQLQPSVQVATQGFLGGSLTAQVGGAWYALFGWGRTNLKPYFNLNFDPNDALTFGAGHSTEAGTACSLFIVADDRLHTHQRDWHVNGKLFVDNSRLTLDVLRKSGLSDAGPIVAWGASVTWDRRRWFARLARDPYQNFSAQSAWRLAGGVRF